MGGPRFNIISEEAISKAEGNYRSLYLPIARNVLPDSLAIFDFADPAAPLGAREATIVPPQALYLLNSEFIERHAARIAAVVLQAEQPTFEARFGR